MDRFDKNLLQNPMDLAQRIAACEQEIQKGMIGQQEIIRQQWKQVSLEKAVEEIHSRSKQDISD